MGFYRMGTDFIPNNDPSRLAIMYQWQSRLCAAGTAIRRIIATRQGSYVKLSMYIRIRAEP
jgi:hypothetical protein